MRVRPSNCARDEPRLLVRLLRDVAEDAEHVVGARRLVLEHKAPHEEPARRLAAAPVLIGRIGGKGAEAGNERIERMSGVLLRRLPRARELRQLLRQTEQARAVRRERRHIPAHIVADHQQVEQRGGLIEELLEPAEPPHLQPQAMNIEKEACKEARQENKKEFFHRIKASFLLFSIFGIPIIQKNAANGKSPRSRRCVFSCKA